MKNFRRILFYPEHHEYAGGLRIWICAVLMIGILLATGYLEGLDQTNF